MALTNGLLSIMDNDDIIFVITKEELQNEAIEKIGRKLTDEEINIAKDAYEWGLRPLSIDIINNTIFTEMINEDRN